MLKSIYILHLFISCKLVEWGGRGNPMFINFERAKWINKGPFQFFYGFSKWKSPWVWRRRGGRPDDQISGHTIVPSDCPLLHTGGWSRRSGEPSRPPEYPGEDRRFLWEDRRAPPSLWRVSGFPQWLSRLNNKQTTLFSNQCLVLTLLHHSIL